MRPHSNPWLNCSRTLRCRAAPKRSSSRRAAVPGPQSHGTAGRHDLPFGATNESSGLVGFVPLHRVDEVPARSNPTVQRVVVEADDRRVGVHH